MSKYIYTTSKLNIDTIEDSMTKRETISKLLYNMNMEELEKIFTIEKEFERTEEGTFVVYNASIEV